MNDNLGREILKSGTPLFCDFYHYTVPQTTFLNNRHEEVKTAEAFFRKMPFGSGYVVAAGLGEFLQWVENWQVKDSDIEKMRRLKDCKGEPKFRPEFLDFLRGKRPSVSIKAVPEGELVFADEPVVSITGPSWEVELMELAFLNIFNPQSLVATKAARIVHAARSDGVQRPVFEFGARRSPELGSYTQTRAAFIGGCNGTSNVLAGLYYDIPLVGTMDHSYVMQHEDECEAFRNFLRVNPNDGVILPDTYETRQGIKNAIRASRETGILLPGLRIDSGDLAYWYKEARRMLDEAGLKNSTLTASNDLDEYVIENLVLAQNAKYDVFAAGTKLVTAYDNPALGGVYKAKVCGGRDLIKIAEGKTTIPGATEIIRVIKGGKFAGDIVVPQNQKLLENGCLCQNVISHQINSTDGNQVQFQKGEQAYGLLKDVVINGKVVSDDKDYSLQQIQKTAQENLAKIDESHKRLINPHLYKVGMEDNLYDKQQNLILARRQMNVLSR